MDAEVDVTVYASNYSGTNGIFNAISRFTKVHLPTHNCVGSAPSSRVITTVGPSKGGCPSPIDYRLLLFKQISDISLIT